MDREYLKFFSKAFYLALLLILLGFLIDAEVGEPKGLLKYLLVFADVIKSIGIALLVANVFSFVLGTKEFVDFIKLKLQEIIISNDFIKDLDDKGKHKLAKLTLAPKAEVSKVYSGIERYFDTYLDHSLKLFKNIFRGKVSIDVKAKIDSSSGVVYFDEDIEYRSFRVDQKMGKLRHSFEDAKSKHVRTRITTPDGDAYELDTNNEKDNPDAKDASMVVQKIQDIPDEFVKHDYLDIERNFLEYGEDHWGVFSYKATQPSDGLTVKLQCHDGLKIRYVNTYGASANFGIDPKRPAGAEAVTITCKNWLSPGFGVTVIVSKR